MNKKILVIGSYGFIGKNFIQFLHNKNFPEEQIYEIDIKPITKNNYYNCDITNFSTITEIIKRIKPDEIYNFSGSFTNDFEKDYLNNVISTKNIFESILTNDLLKCKIIINGSAAEYGFIKKDDFIIDENYPLNSVSFYGLSKIFQNYLAKTYFLRNNIQVYIARPFNIIGFGISDNLFIGRLINQIEKNLKEKSKIVLGNLDNERDYIDIEDVLKAYEKIMEFGQPGEIYNIGSGKSIKIRDILNLFLEIFNIDKGYVEIGENLKQKYDIPKIIADITKIRKLFWNPEISIRESIIKIKNQILEKKATIK